MIHKLSRGNYSLVGMSCRMPEDAGDELQATGDMKRKQTQGKVPDKRLRSTKDKGGHKGS